MSDDKTPRLGDLNVATVRNENPDVEQAMADLEETAESLRSEKASLEQTIESKDEELAEVREEKQAAEALLAQFREGEREKAFARIAEANDVLPEDDQVDIASLKGTEETEGASLDHLTTMAEFAEKLVSQADDGRVSNTDEEADLSGAGAGDLTDQKLRDAAAEIGMANAYDDMVNDRFDGPNSLDAGDEGGAKDELSQLLSEVSN